LLISPHQPSQVSALVSPAMMGAYSVMLASMTSMAALLWMRVRAGRGQPMVLLLIVAALVAISSEILWLMSWLADEELAGPFYNFGDVLCAACIGSAAVCMEWHAAAPLPEINYERSVESFMPALAALLAIALVAGLLATTRRSDAWILVSLVLLCMLLLLVRQRNVREELRRLQTTVALRDADARLTELVRRSVDLILVVDPACVVRFASPAAERMLARKPADLQGTRAVDLFGPAHVGNLSEWFGSLRAADGASDTEVRTLDAAGGSRIFKINGSNEIDNQLINGMVLTVQDVTEQRALEREVLDVATRERTRLSGEIQDGLVEDLAGIALLLQAAAVSPDPDPIVNRSQLKGIVARVNRTIGAARDLAHGLSPLYVVRGSLTGALRRLAQEHAQRKVVRLTIDPTLDELAIDEYSADHLYRIAQEAVGTAVARADSTCVDLALGRAADAWVISISDDGRRDAAESQSFLTLGLKLIEYRARILGGTVRVDSLGEGGASVVVTVPRRASAPVVLQARKIAVRRRS
jgi:PAS domain S-box-containing protein